MHVKRQLYGGRPALALYIRDKTKRVREKLYRMKRQEDYQLSQQIESFTSTISHELRTPIMTVLFFLQRVMSIITANPFDSSKLREAARFCDLVVCSVELMQCFVGDLLDLR